ncbi:MAG: hypothetical protein PUB96_07095, partial [Helicobacteraceae bacterium]|nr:hypothetical protein [Helicobacteraceae bacterium]
DEILRAAQYDKIESQNKAESSLKDSTSDAITKESSEILETQEGLKLPKEALKEKRAEVVEKLRSLENKKIKNLNDGTEAQITISGVKEMLSAKALSQSVKNGFSEAQHIKAVENIASLWGKAEFLETQAQNHLKDYVKEYRIYKADFENAKAIIDIQARKVGDDIVYFVKLENLQPNISLQEGLNAEIKGLKTAVETEFAPTLPSAESKSDYNIKKPQSTKAREFLNKKPLELYQNIIFLAEDNLAKKANSYVDNGGGNSGKVAMAHLRQTESRFNKKTKNKFLSEYFKDYPAPQEIDLNKARELTFLNKSGKKLSEQDLSDLFNFYKNYNEKAELEKYNNLKGKAKSQAIKPLKESEIEYAFSKELLEKNLNEYEKELQELAKAYDLGKDFTEGRHLDNERYRYGIGRVTRENDFTKDRRDITIFKDLAKHIDFLKRDNSFLEEELSNKEALLKDADFLLKNLPFYANGFTDFFGVNSRFSHLKEKAAHDLMQKLHKSGADPLEIVEKLQDRELIAQIARAEFAKKYFYRNAKGQEAKIKGYLPNSNNANLQESTQAIYKDSSGNIKTEADIEKEILEKKPQYKNYKDENKKEALRIAKRSVIKQQGLKLIEYKPQATLNPTDPQDVILSESEKSKKRMRYFAQLSMTKRMRYFAQLSMTK